MTEKTESTATVRVDTANTRVVLSDEVKKTLDPKFLKRLPEKGERGKPGYKPGRPAAISTEKYGILSFESLKIACGQDGGIQSRVIPQGEEFAGQTEYTIQTVEEFECLAISIQTHKAGVRAEREQKEEERIANSPAALARQATDAVTELFRSIDFHRQMNTPREGERKRPGPQLDLAPFVQEAQNLNAKRSEAQLAKNIEVLKSIPEKAKDVALRAEKAVADHLTESIKSRLQFHADELGNETVQRLDLQLKKIGEAYEQSGDPQTARRALVDLNKEVGNEVRIVRGGIYTIPNREGDRGQRPTGPRPVRGGGTTLGQVATHNASQRDNRR